MIALAVSASAIAEHVGLGFVGLALAMVAFAGSGRRDR